MKTLNLEMPFNNLSFGNCAFGISYELFKLGVDCCIFPVGQPDMSAFDKAPQEYLKWLEAGMKKSISTFNRKNPGLKLWHVGGSQNRISDNQFLLTFHETDTLTKEEVNILNNQTGVFVASEYNKNVFEKSGVHNVTTVGLGFDYLHFHKIEKRLVPNDVISFGLLGKAENRKRTAKVLNTWAKLYGDNPRYFLQLGIFNNFFGNDDRTRQEQNLNFIAQALEGKKYHNINIMPYVKTNSEYNRILNAIDIIIDGSGAEAWSLPSFSCGALGKHGVLHDCAGASTWSKQSGFELIESCGKIPVYDGMFFHEGQPFNQGNIFDFSEDDLVSALERAEGKYINNPVNKEGLNLSKEFSWEKTTKTILGNIF